MSQNQAVTDTRTHSPFSFAREVSDIDIPETQECVGHEIVSIPNGRTYGIAGHIPCDHSAVFYYPAAVNKVSTYTEKNGWKHYPAG